MLTPQQFVEKWRNTPLKERQSYQLHFMDVCQLVGHETPGGEGMDSHGRTFAFEYGVKKDVGGQGFADVFYDGRFAIEYKAPGKYKDLEAAYQQLLQYRERLNNPPLLVVTDIQNWEIHTNWPATEKKVYKFTHDDIANRPSVQKYLRDLFQSPDRLHPKRNTEQVTTDAADVFRVIAEDMRRERDVNAERIAHFLTKLVFCLFAEDAALLPSGPKGETGIFAEIVENTLKEPSRFIRYTRELFEAMANGGEVMFQKIPYFNGSLFDDVEVEELSPEALGKLGKAANLNWESVEPAIFGTLFERSLDPSKRAQLGAHYTSREDILLIVEPVLMQPLRREWEQIKLQAAPIREKFEAALKSTNRRDQQTHQRQLENLRETMLHRLREIKVLDPACGSGNFLYVSLQLLMDMEKEVLFHELWTGLTLPIPGVHPHQMYGIEINPIAHDLASIVVWIGYIQWRKNNGYYQAFGEPILEDLSDNIRLMDAILDLTPRPPLRSNSEGEQDSRLRSNSEGEQDSPLQDIGEGQGVRLIPTDEQGARLIPTDEPGGWSRWAHTHTPPDLYDKIKPLAREMRKEPTPAEDALWQQLRNRRVMDFKFRRQHSIDRFIVDFYCAEAHLVIEVDGAIHDYTQEEDALRTALLESLGLRVVRFTNGEVLQQINGVLERIAEVLQEFNDLAGESNLTPQSIAGNNLTPQSTGENDLTPQSIAGNNLTPQSTGENDLTPQSPLRSNREGTSDSPLQDIGEGQGVRLIPSEPDWPEVDVIVGNPPFLGGNRIRAELGDDYVDKLFKLYEGRVPAFADLVCYWFEKARAHIQQGKAKRAGLLATNSIRGGVNREVLKRIKESGDIFMAWSDREWVLNGADVRVSMVGFGENNLTPQPPLRSNREGEQKMLDGRVVATINADLTASVDITEASQLTENFNIQFEGTKKGAKFEIGYELAQKMLRASNSSGRSNSDVVHPWLNGTDVADRSAQKWIVDFGISRPLEEAQLYEMPFAYVEQNIKPKYEATRRNWWLHERTRPELRRAINSLSRYIVTIRHSKHRLFAWVDKNVVPDSALIAFAREDDYFFGVLHSRIHEVWALRMGTSLEDRPRYTPTTTFETFPFPWSPGQEDVNHPAYQAVSAAAKRLHEEREAWLNPTPSNLTPKSPLRSNREGTSDSPLQEFGEGQGVRSNTTSGVRLKDRTLTNLYNALNVWRGKDKMKVKADAGDFAPRLAELHDALDAAVCAAYGWDVDVLADEEAILSRLLALNGARSNPVIMSITEDWEG